MRRLLRGSAWVLGIALVLAAALLAAPFFVPLEGLIPELTRIASEKLGQPVTMAELRLQMLPTPRAVATGITVGKRQEVRVAELSIVPDLLSIFSGPKMIRLVRAEGVQVKESALAMAGKMPKGGQGEDIRVKLVELHKVKLHHSMVKLPEFDVRAELGEGFALEVARLETRDNALRIIIDPQGNGLANVVLEATRWTVPAGLPIRFEWLAIQGTLKGQHLELAKIEGRLYGGKLAGSALADWGRQWQVSGKAALTGVDVVPLQRVLGQKPQLTGKLNSEATFSARARTPAQLQDALVLDGPFEVVQGVYQGYDLSKMSIKKLDQGGSTRFDELTGNVQMRGKEVKVTELCARSPSLVASGSVTVAADDKLSGKLDVSLTKTGGFVGIPVSLSGTTADPSFMPTKGYVIGAAIGTVLLPVIGTSIGSSLGSRMEGISKCK